MAKYLARVHIAGYKPGQQVPEEIGKANEGRFARDGEKQIPVVEKVEEDKADPEPEAGEKKKPGRKRKGE
jgi:hypothetical protein